MDKKTLVQSIVLETGLRPSQVEKALNAFAAVTGNTLKTGADVSIPGFGKFTSSIRPARRGRNPKTGEEMFIKECRVVKFKPFQALKDFVKEG